MKHPAKVTVAAIACWATALLPLLAEPVAPALAGVSRVSAASLPDRIGAPASVLQMVTVTSPAWSSTTGTLKAWQRSRGGDWRKVHGPLSVVLGYSGWVVAAHRRQNTGTTPAGRFKLPFAFGGKDDPGTSLVYHHVDGNDWWPYEPHDAATYNVYQFHKDSRTHWLADYAEHLVDYPTQYAYAVVVGFNLPSGIHYSPARNQWVATHRANTHRGGGIFLHVKGSGSTEGCVAMTSANVQWLLRWLDPAQHAQLVMGPYDYVLQL